MTLTSERSDPEHIPCAVITIDEKMGGAYVWEDQANTLAQRDYKQPQAVIYEYSDYPE